MKMITNYLNSLESYLPEELKQEVRDELEASIMEQVDEQQAEMGRELSLTEQAELLKKIGHPMRVAAAYLPNQELIGKDYYPLYRKALELALVIILSINLLIALPDIFTSRSIIGSAIGLFFHLAETSIWVFAIVTFIFFLMQKNDTNIEQLYAWSPENLSSNNRRQPFSRLEAFFEVAMQFLFLAWWNNFLVWPAITLSEDVNFTLSLSQEFAAVLWPVNIIVALGIVVDFHKFVIAGWNKLTLSANLLINLAALVVIYQISQFQRFVETTGTLEVHSGWQRVIDGSNLSALIVLGSLTCFILWDSYSSFKHLTR